MQDARIRTALVIICLACLLGSSVILLRGRQSAAPPITFTASAAAAKSAAKSVPAAVVSKRPAPLYVDVAGAVQRPSLYVLPPNSRVMQAIRAAGGPTAAADLDAVNLAQPVTDGEKVFVPTRGSSSVATAAAPSSAAPLPAVGAVKQSAPVAASTATPGSSHSGKISAGSSEQIALNSATVEQLERLPGVGPSMAARILAYRQQSGGFAKIEDLTLVTGIGPKKYAKIAPFVVL